MVETSEISKREEQILKSWQKNKIFEKTLEKTKNKKPYIFYDGPPFATGLPHYGHLLASILKDIFPRFFTMKGRYVQRRWGWDCHGLPIENIVEKTLKINSKNEIEKLGIAKFNSQCRSQVLTFAEDWKKFVDRIGRWVDFDNSYKTMDRDYMESVWWAFKELYDKNYLYEGEKILMYCPRCSTPLAKSEIAMDNSYKKIKDLTVVVKFKLKNQEAYALAWTTTPWTLVSNLALTVNPKLTYVFVKDKEDENVYLLAKDLIQNFYKSEEEYQIIKEVNGEKLEGIEYEPLYPYFKDNKNSFKILVDDFVTAEEGTGIVHTAPAFGEDDNIVARKYKIPMVQPVDENGRFTYEVKDYVGEYIHDTNEKIVIDLKKSGKALFSKKMEHEYPFCYRCDTKLMYRALPAWFVDIQKVKKKLLELNMKINWIPEFLKEGRMKHNISSAPDWNITRNRYWATAIPMWKSKSGKIKVIGSINELKKFAKNLQTKEIDLHKDYLDKIKLEINGEEYTRIPEVLDCWFESGAMTFAQFHYPFENKEFFDKNFPAQFVVEYIAQTRAWFYYMMVLSAILFDKIPFENVLTTGTILAEDGQKMSKSKKNFPDPMIVINKYGADALRFYLLQSPVVNADNFNFSEKGMEEVYKKILVLLYNVNNFYLMNKTQEDAEYIESKNPIDKWIISRTEELIKVVEENLNNYNTIKACQFIKKYIDDLSTWYVRISRDRFSEGDISAKKTLRYVLEKISKTFAPIMPYSSDFIFRGLDNKNKSVHLEDWPIADEKKVDKNLSEEMEKVREIVSLGLKERDQNKIGLKWPLNKIIIYSEKIEGYEDLILEQLNVKKIEFKSGKKELSVKLDTKITPELEAEGYAREIIRQVQSFRKELGLEKKDKINLTIFIEDKLEDILKNQQKFIQSKTNSEYINIASVTTEKEKFKNEIDFKIKDKRGRIRIDYIKNTTNK